MRRLLLLLTLPLLASPGPNARLGQDAPSQDPVVAKPALKIEDFAWLAGEWRGKGLGGICEEIWSRPLAGTMVGTFRLVKDGQVVFYEIMVLGADEKGFALKVKHFSKDFVAWEDKKGCVRFAAESVTKNTAKFNGLRFARDRNKLEIKLRMKGRDGTTRWVPFDLERRTNKQQ